MIIDHDVTEFRRVVAKSNLTVCSVFFEDFFGDSGYWLAEILS